jgi:hypothetical protein
MLNLCCLDFQRLLGIEIKYPTIINQFFFFINQFLKTKVRNWILKNYVASKQGLSLRSHERVNFSVSTV